MLYAIVGTDIENSLPLRKENRPAHLDRLNQLHAEGRIAIAGPLPAVDSSEPGDAGFTGSVIVAEFESLDAATRWADDDPYKKAGVYASVVVKPFLQVLPA